MATNVGGDEQLEILEEDIQTLHSDLKSGDLIDFQGVIQEINQVLEEEDEHLEAKINNEVSGLEKAREKLKDELQYGKKEVDLTKPVVKEWNELVEFVDQNVDKENGKITADQVRKIKSRLSEILKRLENILELEREEFKELSASDAETPIFEFVEKELKQATENHQRIALYREALVHVSKETYAVDSRFDGGLSKNYKLARKLSEAQLEEIKQEWINFENHVEKVEQVWLPNIIDSEKEFLDVLEDVLGELESLAQLDEELLEEIEKKTKGGYTRFGIGQGDLRELGKFKEVDYSGDEVGQENAELPSTMDILNKIREFVTDLKKRDMAEENQVEKLIGEVREHVTQHRDALESERGRIDNIDTSEVDPNEGPAGDYPAPVAREAEDLYKHLSEALEAKDGGLWDIPLEEELEDIRERARKIHRLEDEEIEDVADFDRRAHQIRQVIAGEKSKGDDIKGIAIAFSEFRAGREGLMSVFDLPTAKQLRNAGFGDESLPEYISTRNLENINPNKFLTQENVLEGGLIFQKGLWHIKQPGDKGGEGLLTKLEKDIQKIYGEESDERETFQQLENELEEARRKFREIESAWYSYDAKMEELGDASKTVRMGYGGDDERMRIGAAAFNATAMKIYSHENMSDQQKINRLKEEIENDLKPWMEKVENLFKDIEGVIYLEENSIIDEEHMEKQEIEEAIKEIVRSLKTLDQAFSDPSSSAPDSTVPIEATVDEIQKGLRRIAEKATSFEGSVEEDMNKFERWAGEIDEDLQGVVDRAEKNDEEFRGKGPIPKEEMTDDIDFGDS